MSLLLLLPPAPFFFVSFLSLGHVRPTPPASLCVRVLGRSPDQAVMEGTGSPAVSEEDSGYVDWLKKQMMRSTPGMDQDEIDWKFKVDNRQIGNSFLHAEVTPRASPK